MPFKWSLLLARKTHLTYIFLHRFNKIKKNVRNFVISVIS